MYFNPLSLLLVYLASLGCLASPALAQGPNGPLVPPDLSRGGTCSECDETLHIQANCFSSTFCRISQVSQGGGTTFNAHCADDFNIPEDEVWYLRQVYARGVYTGIDPVPDGFNVFIYDDAGGGPGALIVSQQTLPYTDVGLGTGSVLINLSPTFRLAPGTYWLSIQADLPDGGVEDRRWYWCRDSTDNGEPGVFRNPDGFFCANPTWIALVNSCDDMHPDLPDLEFEICGVSRLIDCGSSQTQFQKILPSDGRPGDELGLGIAASGTYALLGAFQDDDEGTDAGSTYIYEYDGLVWDQVGKLVTLDGLNSGDNFGISVSMSESVALVGARFHGGSGAAYVFSQSGEAFSEAQKLVPSDGASMDRFGQSLDLDDDVAIVGSWAHQGNGAAYIYRFDGANWIQEQKITATGTLNFGWTVAIDGDVAIVGADLDPFAGTNSGAAYIFRYNGSFWAQEARLIGSDTSNEDFFGSAVDIIGDLAVVGARRDDPFTGPAANSGAVYVFRYDGTGWPQEQMLAACNSLPFDNFGNGGLRTDGTRIFIGAANASGIGHNTGSVYVFADVDGVWIEQEEIQASDGEEKDNYGSRIALNTDGQIFIGAYQEDGNGTSSGAVYVTNLSLPPAPPVLSGPTAIYESTTHTYFATSSSAYETDLKYTFNWGDGSPSSLAYAQSGSQASADHTYSGEGSFTLDVVTEDLFSGKTTSRQIQVDVADIDCRAGNVDVDAGNPAARVLKVNGQSGSGPERILFVDKDSAMQVSLDLAPAGPASGSHAIWVWTSAPTSGTQKQLLLQSGQIDLGPMCMDPLNGTCNAVCPTYSAKSIPGRCALVLCSTPEATGANPPGVIMVIPGGTFSAGDRLWVQGVLKDASDTSGMRFSVTNGIEVHVTN